LKKEEDEDEDEELVIIPWFGMALGIGVEGSRCMAHS
jgi:hypothetical protein